MKAMHDLICNVSPRDVFVFFCTLLSLLTLTLLFIMSLDVGHSGQQKVTTDLHEANSLNECPYHPLLPIPVQF
jgi:Flp pilus assembly protein TadG